MQSRVGAALVAVSIGWASGAAAEIKVAASIAPVHSLAAMVTDGITEPALIVRPGASPHGYAMKPSEAQSLDRADVVFWVGEALEPWMAKAIGTLAGDALVVELAEADGVTRLEPRAGGAWAADDHHHDDGHGGEAGHGIDPHLWLDPANAIAWLGAMSDALAAADPANAERYAANAERADTMIRTLTGEIETGLRAVRETPYVVFHDAYHYFERRFGLHPVGSISLGDGSAPGAARIIEIRARIAESKAVCVFAEPQFEPKLVDTVIEGSPVRKAVLDPVGADLVPGAELYSALMRRLATSLRDCLG